MVSRIMPLADSAVRRNVLEGKVAGADRGIGDVERGAGGGDEVVGAGHVDGAAMGEAQAGATCCGDRDVGHRDGADTGAAVADAVAGARGGIDADVADGMAGGAGEQIDAVVGAAAHLDDRIGARTGIGGDDLAGRRTGERQRLAAADQVDAVGKIDAVRLAVGPGAVLQNDVIAGAGRVRRVEGRDRIERMRLGAVRAAGRRGVVDQEPDLGDDAEALVGDDGRDWRPPVPVAPLSLVVTVRVSAPVKSAAVVENTVAGRQRGGNLSQAYP